MVKLILEKANKRSIICQFNEALKNVKKNNGVLNQEGIRFILNVYKALKNKVKMMRNLIIVSMGLPLTVIALVLISGIYNIFLSVLMISVSIVFLYLMADVLLLLRNELKESEQIISELK